MKSDTSTLLTKYQRLELENLTLEQCKEALQLLNNRVKQLTNADYMSYLKKNVKDLPISNRSYNALIQAGLHTVGDILDFGLEKISLLRGCGEKCNKEIKAGIMNIPSFNL